MTNYEYVEPLHEVLFTTIFCLGNLVALVFAMTMLIILLCVFVVCIILLCCSCTPPSC